MKNIYVSLICAGLLFVQLQASGQQVEKISYKAGTTDGYYLAITPASHQVKGIVILLSSFKSAESLLPETRLHNIAAANDVLTVYASWNYQMFGNVLR